MLKNWRIENFKAIVNSGDLKLAPVTVFAGLNSSGKSSLLQSILMISQTLSNRLPQRALITNGPIVQLGRFRDILNDSSELGVLTLGFALDEAPISVKINVKFRESVNSNDIVLKLPSSQVEVQSISVEADIWSFDFESEETKEHQIKFTIENDNLDEFSEYKIYSLLGSFEAKRLQLLQNGSRTDAIGLSHFLPSYIFREITVNTSDTENNVNKKDNLEFTNDVNYDKVENYITRFFVSQIRYLGPLRAEPNTIQGFSPNSELDDVGSKGQYAAAVYEATQAVHIQWYHPDSKQVVDGTLKEALNVWARYLGVAREIKSSEAGQSGYTWQVVHKEGQRALPLSALGVGVSQILPILVTGLLSPKNTLLIIEQPELHLHPRVQARLGDFFMGLAKCQKQCLIETHSENLVNQLRYHIVEAGGQDKSDCLIYFVDQDEQGAAKFKQIEISPNGNILNWPEGFLDESIYQEELITAVGLKKRTSATKNGKHG